MDTSDERSVRIATLLQQAGLPSFPLDAEGFPLPGPVIRYFREKMIYTGSDGKEHHWSQSYLAKHLNVAELRVRLMETQNKGLEHMDRRKLIADLLRIPPALLGLATYQQLEESLSVIEKKSSTTTQNDVELGQSVLTMCRSAYDKGNVDVKVVEFWISQIHPSTNNTAVLRLLCQYHILAARSYNHDLLDKARAIKHLNKAQKIAVNLDDNDMIATVHYYLGELFLEQHEAGLAQHEFDIALKFARLKALRGHIMTYNALAHAMSNRTMADRVIAQQSLDNAHEFVDPYICENGMIFDKTKHITDSADTFIALGLYHKALDVITNARTVNVQRRADYLHILSAECYIKQKRPDYDRATDILHGVLDGTHNKYQIQYIHRLYTLLQQSTFANSPDVSDLGMALRERAKR